MNYQILVPTIEHPIILIDQHYLIILVHNNAFCTVVMDISFTREKMNTIGQFCS